MVVLLIIKSTKAMNKHAEKSNMQGLARIVERNIDALLKRHKQEEKTKTIEEKIADTVTRFTGSMMFVYIHLALFGIWIFWNLGWMGLKPFDPSFVVLAMFASVEAIFLSTFVLISQNRMAALADKRADLDVQISLLTEHELTRLIALVSALSRHIGVQTEVDEEVEELKQDVAPEAVLDQIETERKQVG